MTRFNFLILALYKFTYLLTYLLMTIQGHVFWSQWNGVKGTK